MQVPVMRGVIERRILVNYRVDPAALQAVLPHPFRPQRVHGYGIGGICLIRLGQLRPDGLPALAGLRSENAAHRIAVEWTDGGTLRRGVYVPRRDTDSLLGTLVGGRWFPGVQHRADFQIEEHPPWYHVALHSRDDATHLSVRAQTADQLPPGSVFADLAAASDFFAAGSIGYSPGREAGCCDGMELCCEQWAMTPLRVTEVRSSYFEDPARFPPGTATFDSALFMKDIAHTWQTRQRLQTAPAAD